MTTKERVYHLLFCLFAPAVLALVTYATTALNVDFSGTDRAIVWAEGSPESIETAEKLLTTEGRFTDGRVASPSDHTQAPTGCSTESHQLSIGGLRMEQAQAAREFIEQIILEAGAGVCSSNHFSINELPDKSTADDWTIASVAALQSGLIPLGFVICGYWAFAAQFKLPGTNPLGLTGKQIVSGAIPAAVAGVLVLQSVSYVAHFFSERHDFSPPFTLNGTGYPLAFAIVVATPLMEEIALRAWLITFAERAVGPLAAAIYSMLAYAAISMPSSFGDAISSMLLGAILAALYLRTRSLAACVLANSLVSASAFMPWPW